MREKYESLALVQLKELAKARGLKGTSAMKKAELVEAMLAEDERVKKQEAEKAAKSEETQQTSDSVSKPVRRRNVVTNTRTTPPRTERTERTEKPERAERQERTERPEKTERPSGVMNESTYRAEPTAQSESVPKAEELSRADAQTLNPAAPRPNRANEVYDEKTYPKELDSGEEASGILEVMPDGYGFIRCENYLPGENDVYVAPSQIRRFGLKTGDILRGNKRVKTQQEKFSALLFIRTINGYSIEEASKRRAFEDMTPIFPDERIKLETPGSSVAMRVMDLVSPIGKGQRGMIVSPPKAGKTTLLKEVAKSILRTNPRMHMLILLIDERPEEVTDVKEAISGTNVEVIYSTFDELPEHHKRVSEMVIERAKRLVEHKKDVVILLDSITRLARAYNLVVPPSGRTLSGGLDPAALHMPKRFFGAARNMRGGGSLTILATALVDTGSKMDDVIYEEFKSTGNMEMILDRKLSEKRIFPAIDLAKSGTRREDLLLNPEELDAINIMRKALNGLKSDEATDRILDLFARTRNNSEFVQMVKRNKFI
ncbi:MAG: transcription termination factor Rho [Lachnospiraceae bacterium]|nr:transcription termination factor Rho [Lachnospiraceae bacterium]